ncbi:ABC transporter substrate-binding protein [Candidatus Halobeggiatoa sp. HSG11]|nr:ABC transporter substrate-binding protein [Candidatus Halobeggiatoa sp. HSG11]
MKYFITILVTVIIVLGFVALNFYSKQEPIHIAFIGPMSGNGAAAGKLMTQAIQLRLDKVNAKGGINNQQILLDIFDDKNDKTQARQQALAIVEQNQAVAVIGHWYSSASISGGEIYQQYKIPAISPGSTNVNVTLNNDWYFRTIFNAKSSGQFLANYVKKVFKQDAVTIIQEQAAYGSYLADIFAETSIKMGSKVKYRWAFDSSDSYLDNTLAKIVNHLKTKPDAGVVFLAVQALEGIKLVKLMKEAGITNRIISETSFSEKTFIHGFDQFPIEKTSPGYYTNNIYVATPLIFDTANKKAQQFRESYQATYQEEPDWAGAYATDSVLTLLQAIEKTNITGQNITEDRKKIRNYLASMNNINKSIRGLTGFNYFDQNGDAMKPVSIGVFRNGSIISASTQLQDVPYVNQLPDLKTEIEEERIALIGDKYMYKTNVVYVGIELNKISELDTNHLTYMMDFYLWFRFQGDLNTKNIEFLNAVDPIQLEEPIVEKLGDQTSHLYHVKGKFKSQFFTDYYAYQQYELGMAFHHNDLTNNNLVYVTDILGMGITTQSLLDKIQQAQILEMASEWKIKNIRFFQDNIYKSSLGSLKYLNIPDQQIEFSQFNISLTIKNSQFTLRGRLPFYTSLELAMISFIILFMLMQAEKKFFSFFKYIWLLEVACILTLLLVGEIIFLELLAFGANGHLRYIILIFDVLWWLTPAFLVNLIIKHFIWGPLEGRTDQPVPTVVRIFIAFIVYLLAFFGIVAFVYDQALTSLLATSGVIAMIIGLAIQINISNIFSGIVINVERPFRVNDGIKIQLGKVFHEGKVVDITWRTTRLLTNEGYVLSVPNSVASEAVIHNYNYTEELCQSSVNIRIDYAHPPERVEKILLDATLSTDDVLKDPHPACRFKKFIDWAAEYTILFYVNDYGKKMACNEAVFKRVWIHLNRAGIVPPVVRQEVQTFQGIKSRRLDEASKPMALLHEIDIFLPFSEEIKTYLSDRMRRHRFVEGETVVKQGADGDSLFVIVEGVVVVQVELEDKKTIDVARLGAGNFFGEMALFTGQKRAATILTMTDTILLEIIKDDFVPLIDKQPEVAQLISKVLTRRKMKTQSQLNSTPSEKDVIYKEMLDGVGDFFGLDNHCE